MSLNDAFKSVIDDSSAKFTESVDLSIVINPEYYKEAVSLVDLPSGLGSIPSIALFVDESCDYDPIYHNEGVEKINIADTLVSPDRYDWYLSTPSLMPKIASRFAKLLGPRGLMPNPKFGTVTDDIDDLIKRIRSGVVRFKSDKHGNVNLKIGTVVLTAPQLSENLKSVLKALSFCKPQSCKGDYIKNIFISSTMGSSNRLHYSCYADFI